MCKVYIAVLTLVTDVLNVSNANFIGTLLIINGPQTPRVPVPIPPPVGTRTAVGQTQGRVGVRLSLRARDPSE